MEVQLGGLGRAVARLGQWAVNVPYPLFVALAFALSVAKATFDWQGNWLSVAAREFPDPVSAVSTNFVGIALTNLSPANSSPILLGASLMALGAAVIVLARLLAGSQATTEKRRVAIVAALSWPAVLASLPWLSNGSAFLPLFVVLAVLAKSRSLIVIGLLGAALTHPEHSFAAFACLLVLTFESDFKVFRVRAFVGLGISSLIVALSAIWMASGGVPSRLPLILDSANVSLRWAVRHGILGVYSWWSVWWLVIALAFVAAVGLRRKLWLLAAAVLIPGLLTVLTADYTRVFVAVSSAVGVALAWKIFQDEESELTSQPAKQRLPEGFVLGVWIIAWLALPNLVFLYPSDGIAEPGFYPFGLVENYVLPRLGL